MNGKMGRRAAEDVGEANLRSTNMEASERPARAILCETRDLGIKWLQRHTLAYEEQTKVDLRTVFPQDVKNMLLNQARQAYWKRWAAKHEHEELKEGVWLEPIN